MPGVAKYISNSNHFWSSVRHLKFFIDNHTSLELAVLYQFATYIQNLCGAPDMYVLTIMQKILSKEY